MSTNTPRNGVQHPPISSILEPGLHTTKLQKQAFRVRGVSKITVQINSFDTRSEEKEYRIERLFLKTIRSCSKASCSKTTILRGRGPIFCSKPPVFPVFLWPHRSRMGRMMRSLGRPTFGYLCRRKLHPSHAKLWFLNKTLLSSFVVSSKINV